MNWTNIAIGIFLSIHIVVCLLMVFVILMQRSKQEGLGAAFGGGITDSMFGAQTSQVLVRATVWLAILFFGLTIVLARLYANRNSLKDNTIKSLLATPATTPANDAKAQVEKAIKDQVAAPTSATTAAPVTAPAAPAPAPAKK